MRHYVRLSRKNYGIDTGIFPLGSCTMKHNPRLNEKMARLPGFGDIHPLQPLSTVPGALELIAELARWLRELTGMPAVALTPKAGAHGELCGMMAIKAALDGARRDSARSCWCRSRRTAPIRRPRRCSATGRDDPGARRTARSIRDEVRKHLSPDVAAIMLTNPNTCGLFERDVVAIADGGARGRRVLLCRRRQLQRHRRQGAAGRPRRRRHAHQPAQDVLDAAWRRRAGRRPGRAVGRARAVRAGAATSSPTRKGVRLSSTPATADGTRSRSAACARSTARWACSCAR